MLLDELQALCQRHPCKGPPLAGTLVAAILYVMQVAGVHISLHLKRVEIVGGILRLAEIAQGEERVPQVEDVEEKPRVARVLRLLQVYHLVVFRKRVAFVHPVGVMLLTGKNMAEQRYGSIPLPAKKTVDGGGHVDNAVRPGCPDDKLQEVQWF